VLAGGHSDAPTHATSRSPVIETAAVSDTDHRERSGGTLGGAAQQAAIVSRRPGFSLGG
jgi:hypothetical protein